MREKLAFLLVGIAFALTACDSRQEAAVISGTISNTDKIAVTHVEDINRRKTKVIDHINVSTDGLFRKSVESLEPHLYELNFPNGKKFEFVSDGKTSLQFKGDAQKPEEIVVTGSEDNEKLQAYEKFRKESLERLVLSVRRQLKAHPQQNGPEFERLGKLEVTNYEKHKKELLDFVKKEMGTSLAVYATSIRWPSDLVLIEPVVKAFEKAHPGLEITKRLKERLAVIKQTAVGGTAPEIRMRDENGKEISLMNSKGKYTLIDFWGSWCGPCRREAETLASLYEKYRGMGFEIYGVGLESDLAKWKEAKETDKRVWPNVLSLSELETAAAYDFGITALPANFLIDSERKIVARDLHDEELSMKLAELFEGE